MYRDSLILGVRDFNGSEVPDKSKFGNELRLSFDRGDDSFGTKLFGAFDMTFKETDKKVWESS